MSTPEHDERVGYGRPPKSTRFRKGQSGNPRGRPPNRHRKLLPYDSVLGEIVTIVENGAEKRVTAEEAFILQQKQMSLQGDVAVIRPFLAALESARETQPTTSPRMDIAFVRPEGIGFVSETLKITTITDQSDQERARRWIEPWMVEAALQRFGSRTLSEKEQRKVRAVTRNPGKVTWPDWWTER